MHTRCFLLFLSVINEKYIKLQYWKCVYLEYDDYLNAMILPFP
jgi:hypothetical protein